MLIKTQKAGVRSTEMPVNARVETGRGEEDRGAQIAITRVNRTAKRNGITEK